MIERIGKDHLEGGIQFNARCSNGKIFKVT